MSTFLNFFLALLTVVAANAEVAPEAIENPTQQDFEGAKNQISRCSADQRRSFSTLGRRFYDHKTGSTMTSTDQKSAREICIAYENCLLKHPLAKNIERKWEGEDSCVALSLALEAFPAKPEWIKLRKMYWRELDKKVPCYPEVKEENELFLGKISTAALVDSMAKWLKVKSCEIYDISFTPYYEGFKGVSESVLVVFGRKMKLHNIHFGYARRTYTCTFTDFSVSESSAPQRYATLHACRDDKTQEEFGRDTFHKLNYDFLNNPDPYLVRIMEASWKYANRGSITFDREDSEFLAIPFVPPPPKDRQVYY